MKGHDHQALDIREARVPVRPVGEYTTLPVRAAEIGLNLIFPSRHNSPIHTGFSPIVREKYE